MLQNRGLLYLQVDDVENALQDFLAAAKVSLLINKKKEILQNTEQVETSDYSVLLMLRRSLVKLFA